MRNLAEKTRIDFSYPITALVGPNGTNKTAILRALQGCPDYENLGNYWFSTNLDIIQPNSRHRFIHGYLALSQGRVVEAIKSRIEKGTRTRSKDDVSQEARAVRVNPDYFEPSRPILGDDMERMPKSVEGIPERTRTRWKAIQKGVVYLDFRSELSAFDKYWFHSPYSSRVPTLSAKKDFIRRRSVKLADAVNGKMNEYVFARKNRVIEAASDLDSVHIRAISTILGREYAGVRTIRHSFFGVDGFTVVLRTGDLYYSEAFAGSGEFAVVMLVKAILGADDGSLVLLDEPETSLHPGAQRNLMAFLREQVKLKKLQVVLSTHAPEIVSDLPPDAIKVLQVRASDGRVQLVGQESDANEAFFRLGSRAGSDYAVFVEDELAAAIVRKAIRPLGSAVFSMVSVAVLPGGAGGIQTKFVPSFAQSDRDRCLVLLDGDQRPDRLAIEVLDALDGDVVDVVEQVLGGKPQLAVSGSRGAAAQEEKVKESRRLLNWIANHVDYLPGSSPEGLLANLVGAQIPLSAAEAKTYWVQAAEVSLGRCEWETVSAREILNHQDRELAAVSDNHVDLVQIRERIRTLIAAGGVSN
ncbi:Predicted ATP-dependent endonuclease of the OLD family, contains P-loop ATPase and TOPRIM domains [Pseudonocardia oroxyli]|uniref:Predicted ATP-dependent endonuclease of the OLD family, contains P-loop ATPase and TOPRIM domains n=2 Tax=Pseudonocardia oroxyli TaxID=366584 RepID=A0A1G7QW52_PSEOR|nr:Predicted ATP-dependent endonuclease of the OLD family, contains P-loop ATPase and TOPRIM domains [Pseudonocardia oroxyli]